MKFKMPEFLSIIDNVVDVAPSNTLPYILDSDKCERTKNMVGKIVKEPNDFLKASPQVKATLEYLFWKRNGNDHLTVIPYVKSFTATSDEFVFPEDFPIDLIKKIKVFGNVNSLNIKIGDTTIPFNDKELNMIILPNLNYRKVIYGESLKGCNIHFVFYYINSKLRDLLNEMDYFIVTNNNKYLYCSNGVISKYLKK